jgi:hypothetical protein
MALREDATGRWLAPTVALVVPRQNGKGSVLEARELYGLFVLGEQILHTAQLFKTSREAFRRIAGLIESTPQLMKRTAEVRRSHGEEEILLKSGARLRFVARTMHSGRGLTADTLIYDEAYDTTDDHLSALNPTLTTSSNPQTWFTSSAALAHSDVLMRVRDRGRAQVPRLAYLEWSANPALAPDDVQAWLQANPSVGYRVDLETLGDMATTMSPAAFRREYLGAWPEDARSEWIIAPETWFSLADRESRIVGEKRFAVDMPWSRERTVIAVAGVREDGRDHVEIVDARPGNSWAVPRLVELADRWAPDVPVALDPSGPAGALLPDLQAAGLEVLRVGGRDLAAACGTFSDRAVAGRLRHLGQSELATALDGARRRPYADAGAYVWDRRDPSVDISPLVAATVALYSAARAAAETEESGWMVSLS